MFSMFKGSKPDENEIIIPSAEHWENLQKRLDQFNSLEMKASDEKDEACYKELNQAILTGIECGKASEGQHIWTKKSLSSQASAASKKVFKEYGNEEIPTPVGAKSLAFIKSIYLAYYLDSQHIKITALYGEQTLLDVFTSGKKDEYKNKAALLNAVIEQFSKNNQELAKKADEVVSKIMPALPMKKSTSTPSETKDQTPGLKIA